MVSVKLFWVQSPQLCERDARKQRARNVPLASAEVRWGGRLRDDPKECLCMRLVPTELTEKWFLSRSLNHALVQHEVVQCLSINFSPFSTFQSVTSEIPSRNAHDVLIVLTLLVKLLGVYGPWFGKKNWGRVPFDQNISNGARNGKGIFHQAGPISFYSHLGTFPATIYTTKCYRIMMRRLS